MTDQDDRNNLTISPQAARARPTPRTTVLAQKTKAIAVELQQKQLQPPTGHPGWMMFWKIARMVIAFVAVLFIGFFLFFPAWTAMMKADSLRAVDVVRIGVGLLLMYVPFWIAARDRAEALVKFIFTLAMAWKRQPATPPSTTPGG